MIGRFLRVAAPAFGAAMCLGLLSNHGEAFVDGPPPAVTGGFRENTCHQCHFDYSLNDSSGALRLDGIPASYTPGSKYLITVRLSHPQLERGGFELASRFASGNRSGKQAGSLETADGRSAVLNSADGEIQYARQTRMGSSPDSKGSIEWSIRWQAPDDSAGPVVFHAAANAANYDDSPLGDFPYALEIMSQPK